MKVYCFKCKHLTEELGRIPFKASCPKCDSDLHVCKNCRFYSPGKPNDCAMPGTDHVRDREASNFCEEFAPSLTPPENSHNQAALDKAKRLFGEDLPKPRNPLLDEDSHGD